MVCIKMIKIFWKFSVTYYFLLNYLTYELYLILLIAGFLTNVRCYIL